MLKQIQYLSDFNPVPASLFTYFMAIQGYILRM